MDIEQIVKGPEENVINLDHDINEYLVYVELFENTFILECGQFQCLQLCIIAFYTEIDIIRHAKTREYRLC